MLCFRAKISGGGNEVRESWEGQFGKERDRNCKGRGLTRTKFPSSLTASLNEVVDLVGFARSFLHLWFEIEREIRLERGEVKKEKREGLRRDEPPKRERPCPSLVEASPARLWWEYRESRDALEI